VNYLRVHYTIFLKHFRRDLVLSYFSPLYWTAVVSDYRDYAPLTIDFLQEKKTSSTSKTIQLSLVSNTTGIAFIKATFSRPLLCFCGEIVYNLLARWYHFSANNGSYVWCAFFYFVL
jgi:hypothetical protein